MSTQVQHRRGSTSEHASFAGASGEFTYDTDKKVVVAHDGSTAGGFPLSRRDQVVGLSGTETVTGNKTFTGLNKIQAMKEKWNIVADNLASGDNNIDILTAAAWYFSTNGDTNAGLNIRGDGSNSLDSLLATGDSITIAVMIKNGGTPYYINSVKIDGTTSGVTTEWLGAAAPSAGTANKKDVYTLTILKTASATFLVEATFGSGH